MKATLTVLDRQYRALPKTVIPMCSALFATRRERVYLRVKPQQGKSTPAESDARPEWHPGRKKHQWKMRPAASLHGRRHALDSIGLVGRSCLHERADAVYGFHQLSGRAMARL